MAGLDAAEFDRRATASTRAVLGTLSVADLDRPVTPDWDVRAVLAHLVGGNIRFAQALRGEAADWPTRNAEPITTPLREFDETATGMAAAAEPADPKRPVLLEAGEPPAFFAVKVHAADMLLHGWDLAVATGRPITLDPELCAAAIGVLDRYPAEFWGPGRFFAARLESASDDPALRLLALSGRDAARATPAPAASP